MRSLLLPGILTLCGLQARTAPDLTPASPVTDAPNPCSGITSVSYRTPPNCPEAQLVVRDYFSGTPRLRQPVPTGEHTVELNVATLPPGIYHYSLEIGGRPVAHHNLLIQ